MVVEMVEDRLGGDGSELGTVWVVELKAPIRIAVEPTGQRVEAVAESRSRVRREPALADQELAR